ncbi:hypothetical protein [Burkholderia anthina]|uniref:hypothetical protein n=1 Tax=Burkholderia anthina TaxID=179879 RepID=UPI00158C5CD2|nr:hypothetical protein [Burkholderia anthina]
MTPKFVPQRAGFHPGPYQPGKTTMNDVSVIATGIDDKPIVVGRFPRSRQVDAEAQAALYQRLPEILELMGGMAEILEFLEPSAEADRLIVGARVILALAKPPEADGEQEAE